MIYDLLKKLVETNTVHDNETELALYLADYFKDNADKIELFGEGKRKNIIAYFGNLNSKNILLFSGHLDTVSALETDWNTDPFVLTKLDGLLYARGTADMKGGIVAAIFAILEAKKAGLLNDKLVIFVGSADEETGADSSLGCKKVVEHLINENIIPTGVIIPEPNAKKDHLKINLGHRGLIWLRCQSEGTVVHSGLLKKEDNAILKMSKFIEAVYSLFPKEPTKENGVPSSSCRVTYINSGTEQGFKRTPSNCVADLDIRISPLEKNENILAQVKAIAKKFEITINMIKNTPAASISKDEKIVKVITEALKESNISYELGYASPTCDAHWFIGYNIPAINGMGATGGNPHAANEYILFDSIEDRIKTFKKIIEKW